MHIYHMGVYTNICKNMQFSYLGPYAYHTIPYRDIHINTHEYIQIPPKHISMHINVYTYTLIHTNKHKYK